MGKKVYNPEFLKTTIKPIFRNRFLEILGSEEEYDKFVEYITKPQRKSFRINTLKVKNPQKIVDSLTSKGIILKEIPWSENSYFVEYEEGKRIDLGNLLEHQLGYIYVQEATSMSPPECLELENGEWRMENRDDFKVLDVASAPGSKTTQIGIKMKNQGVLVANELDYKRIGALKINLERTGISNIIITNQDGTKIEGDEIFDRICLDAPCSGSGVIRKSPGTLKTYNPKRLKGLAILQFRLMKRAFELLKKDGIMTYSTCSIDPEENELAVKNFLEKTPEAELIQCELNGIILKNKLKSFKGKEIPQEIQDKTIRIWPQDNDTNGFYLAKFRKRN